MSATDQPEDISRLLRRAGRSANRVYRERVKELELTVRQANAILALVETPGMSLGALAESMGADQPTASALVDRLLAAELVRRETDPADRRRALLLPTEAAMRLAVRLSEARHSSEELIRQALGPEDTEELARILRRLTDYLRDNDSTPALSEERT